MHSGVTSSSLSRSRSFWYEYNEYIQLLKIFNIRSNLIVTASIFLLEDSHSFEFHETYIYIYFKVHVFLLILMMICLSFVMFERLNIYKMHRHIYSYNYKSVFVFSFELNHCRFSYKNDYKLTISISVDH